MSKKEIEDLLKRGAYGALMDEDGDASTKFCEEDIDQILERRTQVIQIVGEGKGSTFAKVRIKKPTLFSIIQCGILTLDFVITKARNRHCSRPVPVSSASMLVDKCNQE